MEDLKKDNVIRELTDHGICIAVAHQYADAFIEYVLATRNIDEFGPIIKHPRTGNPIENPYLVLRNRALKKLMLFRIRTDYLWERYGVR